MKSERCVCVCINVGGRGAAADNVKISLGLWTCGTNCLPDGILSLIKSRIGKLRQKSGSRFCTCIGFIGYRFYRSILLSGCSYICLLLVCEEKFGFDAALSHLFPTWLSKKKKRKMHHTTPSTNPPDRVLQRAEGLSRFWPTAQCHLSSRSFLITLSKTLKYEAGVIFHISS